MSDSSMIERVGLAIGIACKATGLRGEIWIAPEQQELARTVARAAIEAVREPTDAMLNAGANNLFRSTALMLDLHPASKSSWRAMIDAALQSEPKG